MIVAEKVCINGLTINNLTPRTKEFLLTYCPSPRTAYENQPRQVGACIYIPNLAIMPKEKDIKDFKEKRIVSDKLKNSNRSPRVHP
jgi:hypothetical protein